jgi:hypothetical protein
MRVAFSWRSLGGDGLRTPRPLMKGLSSWRACWIWNVLWCCATLAVSGYARAQADGGAGGEGGAPGEPAANSELHANAPARVSSLKVAFKIEPAEVVRGSVVRLSGANLPTKREDTKIWLDDVEIGRPALAEHDALEFIVPLEGVVEGKLRPLAARRYLLSFSSKKAADEVAGPRVSVGVLRVVPEKLPPLRLDGLSPTVVYPAPSTGADQHGAGADTTPTMVVTGDGFGGRLRDYRLLIDGTERELCPRLEQGTTHHPREDESCRGISASFVSDHQLELYGPFDAADGTRLSGDHMIGLRAGDITASRALKVAFSSYPASTIRLAAVAVTSLVLLALVALAAFGGRTHRVGRHEFVGNAFLIDTETDTYSLSKLQFYAWSAAALLAYSYLSLSRCLVQGKLDIADVPQNLPIIWGLSAGTAVLSVGIAKVRGAKASGEVHPSFADLLSTGGVVSPERFQFFLWTIVAILTFVLNVWNVDPMVLNDLPKVPDGLLAISGVSAAAYLGGKLVRGAGPIIDEVLAAPVDGTAAGTSLLILGSNLGLDATFEVDGHPITELLDPKVHPDRRAIVVKREDRDGTQFAKSLRLALTRLPEKWIELLKQSEDPGDLPSLTIVNRDGQRADVQVPRAILSAASPAPEGTTSGAGV